MKNPEATSFWVFKDSIFEFFAHGGGNTSPTARFSVVSYGFKPKGLRPDKIKKER
jgi:hypothetical protein